MVQRNWIRVSSLALVAVSCGGRETTKGVGTTNGVPGSAAEIASPLGAGGCSSATTTNGFVTSPLAAQSGTFTVQFDATPAGSGSDELFGLSRGAPSGYASLAAIVRFNPGGTIDVRNGNVYASDVVAPYVGGQSYHFQLDVNLITHRYSVHVSGLSIGWILLASDYAFRTEQASVTTLDHYALKVDAGTGLSVCGVAVSGVCSVAVPGGGFVNTGFGAEGMFLTAAFSARPGANGIDGVVGLSALPSATFNDLAAAVRFSDSGVIEARNGSVYAADAVVPYAKDGYYYFEVLTDIGFHSYSVVVDSQVLARNYAFRTQQASVASLANLTVVTDSTAGQLSVCEFKEAPPPRALFLHDTLTLASHGLAPSSNTTLVDGAGNVYVFGAFQGAYNAGGAPLVSAGGVDTFVAKYTAGHQHLWSRRFGAAGDDLPVSPAVDAGGDSIVMAGTTVVRLNTDGTVAWTRPISAVGVGLDPSGNTFVAVGPLIVNKLDRVGAPLWSRSFPITGGASLAFARSGGDGRFVLAGGLDGSIDLGSAGMLTAHSNQDGDGARLYIVRLDSSGAIAGKGIGTINIPRSMAVDAHSNAYVSGYKFNPDTFRLDALVGSGEGVGEAAFGLISPLEVGIGEGVSVDPAGNVYWQFSPRVSVGSLGYLVKLPPPM